MDKIDFYNKLVGLTQSTGQGFGTMFGVKIPNFKQIVEELESEGLVKKIKGRTSEICLTNIYCVEEEIAKEDRLLPLMFMRYYLGQKDHDVIEGVGDELTHRQIVKENKAEYIKWLQDNAEGLVAIDFVPLLERKACFDEKTIEYLKSRSWYKENLTLEVCIEQTEAQTKNLRNANFMHKQIIQLSKEIFEDNPTDSAKKQTDEAKADLEENIGKIKMRDFLVATMQESEDLSISIQDYFTKFI